MGQGVEIAISFRVTTRSLIIAVMSRAIHAGALLALACAGCGRFGFDPLERDAAVVCTPVGHDEDADGIDDACDLCPYVADLDQPDLDGDRVGDGCDPHPGEPRDRFVMFDPFVADRPEWEYAGLPHSYANDQLVADSRPTQFRVDLATPPTTDTYTLGVHVAEGNPSGQRQLVLIALAANGLDYFYCELDGDETVTASWQQTVKRVNAPFTSPIFVPATGPIAARDVEITLTLDPTTWICRTTWPAATAILTGVPPAGIVPARFRIGLIGIRAELSYFAWIHSD